MRQTIFAAFLLAATPIIAWAHAKAEQTTPENEATVKTVEVIEIRFDDPIRVTAISMIGPDGEVDVERETGMDAVTEFRALPTAELPVGTYKIDWRGLSADGHPIEGSFGFAIAN